MTLPHGLDGLHDPVVVAVRHVDQHRIQPVDHRELVEIARLDADGDHAQARGPAHHVGVGLGIGNEAMDHAEAAE
jgi:hypothetical protein